MLPNGSQELVVGTDMQIRDYGGICMTSDSRGEMEGARRASRGRTHNPQGDWGRAISGRASGTSAV